MINSLYKTFVFLFVMFFCGSVLPQQFVYTPINPSFGGSPLSGSWMFSQAQAQNGFTAASQQSTYSPYGNSLENFKQSLQSQILSQLSRNLVSSLFGETGLEEGHYEIGNFLIDITPGINGITIIINDSSTGGQTTIVVPYL